MLIDIVRIKGGDTNILIAAALAHGCRPAELPADVNAVVEDVHISNVCWRSSKRPPFGSGEANVGVQIKQYGCGERS